MITLSDGEAIKKVLNDMESFHAGKGFSDSLSTVAPQSLVILSGQDWKRHRKIVVGAFAPPQLRFAMEVTMERLETMMNKWESLKKVMIY
jgi:cytochrome P450